MSDNSSSNNDVSPSEARKIMQEEEMRLDAEFFLKQLAKDPEMPIETLAQDIDPPIPVARAKKIVQDFVMLLLGTVEEPDFPERIRRVYNDGAEPEDELTRQDMMSLLSLIEKYHAKMISKKNADMLSARMQNMGMSTVNQPSELARRRVSNIPVIQTMKDGTSTATATPQPQGQPQPQAYQYPPQQFPPYQQTPYPQQQQGQEQAQQQQVMQPPSLYPQPPAQPGIPYEDEDSLMKYLLEINHAIVPSQAWKIPNFMNVFKSMKPTWLADPSKLMFILKTTFGNIPGEAVYVQFSGMRNQVTNDPADLYRLTGVGSSNFIPNAAQSFRSMPTPMPTMQGQFGQNPMGMDYESESERRLDKWMERTMKANYMKMMQTMYDNQQPAGMGGGMMQGPMGGMGINPADYDYFEDLNNDGTVKARRFVRKANPQGFAPYDNGNNNRDRTTEMMMKFFETMNNQTSQTNKILMEKMLGGNPPGDHGMGELMGTIVKQVMGAYTVQMNPAENFSRYLELGEKISQMKHQSERPKSIEEKKLELDFMLAKNDMESREKEKAREFQRQQTEQDNANRNIDTVINRVGDTVAKLGEPLLNIALGTMSRGIQGQMDPRAAQLRQQQAAAAAAQQQGPQQVIIHPPPQQQQQQDPLMQMQMEEEENRRRYAQAQAQTQQEYAARQQAQQQTQEQQEYDSRPIEEQLKDFDAEQIEEMAHRGQANLMEQERILNKVMAERARRKGYGGIPGAIPQRKYVSPIVADIAQHEAQQAQQQPQQQQYQPEGQGVDVFDEIEEDIQMPQPPEVNYVNQPSMSALDTSVSADDMMPPMTDEEREELIGSGQISSKPEENLGIPSTSNIEPEYQEPPAPSSTMIARKEPNFDRNEEYELDESDVVDVE